MVFLGSPHSSLRPCRGRLPRTLSHLLCLDSCWVGASGKACGTDCYLHTDRDSLERSVHDINRREKRSWGSRQPLKIVCQQRLTVRARPKEQDESTIVCGCRSEEAFSVDYLCLQNSYLVMCVASRVLHALGALRQDRGGVKIQPGASSGASSRCSESCILYLQWA